MTNNQKNEGYDVLYELSEPVKMPPKSQTQCWLISDERYKLIKRLAALAWKAWAALDHDLEENLVGDLAEVLEELGYD